MLNIKTTIRPSKSIVIWSSFGRKDYFETSIQIRCAIKIILDALRYTSLPANNNLKTIKRLIKGGANVNASDAKSRKPYHVAFEKG